jgi:hypothetical protein
MPSTLDLSEYEINTDAFGNPSLKIVDGKIAMRVNVSVDADHHIGYLPITDDLLALLKKKKKLIKADIADTSKAIYLPEIPTKYLLPPHTSDMPTLPNPDALYATGADSVFAGASVPSLTDTPPVPNTDPVPLDDDDFVQI